MVELRLSRATLFNEHEPTSLPNHHQATDVPAQQNIQPTTRIIKVSMAFRSLFVPRSMKRTPFYCDSELAKLLATGREVCPSGHFGWDKRSLAVMNPSPRTKEFPQDQGTCIS